MALKRRQRDRRSSCCGLSHVRDQDAPAGTCALDLREVHSQVLGLASGGVGSVWLAGTPVTGLRSFGVFIRFSRGSILARRGGALQSQSGAAGRFPGAPPEEILEDLGVVVERVQGLPED